MGALVEFPSGDGVADGMGSGYLATPEHGGAGPALIVLGPGSASAAGACDRFAAEGFTSLAPAVMPDGGPGDHVVGLNLPATIDLLRGAITFLEDHPDVHGQGVGVIGFELGALLALAAGARAPADVKVVVAFDGPMLDDIAAGEWAGLVAPIECHLGVRSADDRREAIDELLAAAKELKRSVDVFTYVGVAPGFFDPASAGHDADAAHEAFTRSLSFLRAHLG